jgi:hypothetical protein
MGGNVWVVTHTRTGDATMTPTAKPARKGTTPRTLRYNAATAVLTITEGRRVEFYHLAEFPVPRSYGAGRGFAVDKLCLGGATHHVFVGETGRTSSCSCPGHTYAGHCRHLSAVEKLVGLGRLPDPRDRAANAGEDVGSTEV